MGLDTAGPALAPCQGSANDMFTAGTHILVCLGQTLGSLYSAHLNSLDAGAGVSNGPLGLSLSGMGRVAGPPAYFPLPL